MIEKNMLAALAACIAAEAGVTVLPSDVMIINTDVRTLNLLDILQMHERMYSHYHGIDALYVGTLVQFDSKPKCKCTYSGLVVSQYFE